ncbi:GNAT family acetyltransferase [Apiospora arundinis]
MASVTSSRRANGTVPTENAGKSDAPKKTKAPATSKKVKIRRLPPGMTGDECWNILGGEWKVDNGKVDWVRFDSGKVANGPFKESKPATAYLRLIDATQDFAALQQLVKTPDIWRDAKETFNDPCLRAPPELVVTEFPKVAMGKTRVDPRQGTIDTDPTYMAFLQQLTEPITSIRDAELGAEDDASKDKPKVTSTPLVTFIKEKKEAKAKEAAAAKSAKQHARQESSGVGKNKDNDDTKKKGKGKESKSSEKTEKASEKGKEKDKQPVKIMTKKAAQQEAVEAANAVADQIATSKTADDGGVPKSRRAGIAAAAKLLQRDLGLSPGSAHRRARQDAAKADTTTKPEPVKAPEKEEEKPKEKEKGKEREREKKGKNAEPQEPAVPTGPKAQNTEGSRRSRGKGKAAAATEPNKGKAAPEPSKPTTGPIILLKKESNKKEEAAPTSSASPATPAQSSTASNATPAPPTGPKAASGGKGAASSKATQSQKKGGVAQPSAGATRAFVKHANPSQGVTEPLLKQAMEVFGSVTFVEIDKRKGFAYVDFGDHAALTKAIAASPVSIAQGTVQVLERKDKKPAAPAPAAAAATPAATQPAPAEKAAPEASAAAATTPTTSEKPKRGRGGRGRRGGGGGKENAGNAAEGKGSPAAPPAT